MFVFKIIIDEIPIKIRMIPITCAWVILKPIILYFSVILIVSIENLSKPFKIRYKQKVYQEPLYFFRFHSAKNATIPKIASYKDVGYTPFGSS